MCASVVFSQSASGKSLRMNLGPVSGSETLLTGCVLLSMRQTKIDSSLFFMLHRRLFPFFLKMRISLYRI